MHKSILWVSRHALSETQKQQLLGLHGQKLSIEQREIRFSDQEHFLDFLREHHEHHYVYCVVPEKWKQRAINSGFSLGTVHRPYTVKDQNRKRLVSRIEFHGTFDLVKESQTSRVLGAKGYVNN